MKKVLVSQATREDANNLNDLDTRWALRKSSENKPSMDVLSKRILSFIVRYISSNDISPSTRDICSAVKANSTSTVTNRLKKLQEVGAITKKKGKARSISVNYEVCKKFGIRPPVDLSSPNFSEQGYWMQRAKTAESRVLELEMLIDKIRDLTSIEALGLTA